MTILAIETSCDETAAAIVEGRSPDQSVEVLSSRVASSEEMHVKTGGIVPEVAAREQVRSIMPVVRAALDDAKIKGGDVDGLAVTIGPGLIGSLLVGVETAKTLAFAWDKPLVPINHLVAHLYATFIGGKNVPLFPAVGLVVSGGHTDLVLMRDHKIIEWLGGTRDDAAGECFDKCAKLLGLGYPGGPAIEKASQQITNSKHQITNQFKIKNLKLKIKLPRPMTDSDDYDFSFSGLKAAVARMISQQETRNNEQRALIAYEVQEAVTDVLVTKVVRAVKEFKPRSVIIGGGVAANLRLREKLVTELLSYRDITLFIPQVELCTDNAVMVGAAAFYTHSPTFAKATAGKPTPWNEVIVDPGLEITSALEK